MIDRDAFEAWWTKEGFSSEANPDINAVKEACELAWDEAWQRGYDEGFAEYANQPGSDA